MTARPTAFLLALLLCLPMRVPAAEAPGAALSHETLQALVPGMPLEDALAVLARAGHSLAYSTAVVRPEMVLAAMPAATTIAELLIEILAPWQLVAERAPNGDWLIVRATRNQAETASPDASGDAALQTIDVTASRYGLAGVASSSETFLTRTEVRALPHLTDDVVRMLHALPGVAGGDISAQLNVRGGRRDEVLLLIDGAEIRDPFHMREVSGAISLVDTNLVESMNFVTGGMTADLGNRMSGVLDIRTLQPAGDDELRNALGVSFINMFARSQGRFASGRGSWLASARRGYLDLIMKRIQDDDEEFTPRYQDAFAKIAYEVGPNTSLAAHALLGADELTFLMDNGTQSSGGDAQTGTVWLTLDHAWSDEVSTVTAVSSGKTDRQREASDDRPDQIAAALRDRAELDSTTLRQDWTWQPRTHYLLRWGVNGQRERGDHDYRRESMITDPALVGGEPVDTSQTVVLESELEALGAYGAWRTRLVESVTMEVGARWDRYEYGDGSAFSRAGPRFNVVFTPGRSTEIRAAYGVIHQPQTVYELQVEDGVSSFFPPEQVEQVTLGFHRRLGASGSLRVDAYRKRYSDVRPLFANLFDAYELIPEAEPDRVRVDAHRARVRGVEATVRGPLSNRLSGWLGYAWSEAEEYDEGWRPRFWDQRHAATASLQWEGVKWRASLASIYHDGWPTTPLRVTEVANPDGSTRLEASFGPRNSERLGSFWRVDLRASRQVRLDRGALTWYLEVFNLLNRDNPCCIEDFDLLAVPGGSFAARPNYDYWLPLLPSFGVVYEF